MNKQEAIEYIKANYPDKYRYEGLCEALDLAIQTLKKQIPKKPIAFWDGNENLIECPTCKCPIDICEAEWSRQFCGKCGQAIDWRLEDE